MKLTIGIKALNEERHIERALKSAVAAARLFHGEIILADSGSTDATLEIASRYPVKIVQFANLADRSCGAGAQLAFQYAEGDFFYILDGDMELAPDFLQAAIPFLEQHPNIAGVGGRVEEAVAVNHEFRVRRDALDDDQVYYPAFVDRLDCGGLYRASAIRQIGYFADRNLHSFEEFELASRLISHGWQLTRLNLPAVKHFGHAMPSYDLLRRRVVSGHTCGPGEVLRGALGQQHFLNVVRDLSQIRNGAIVTLWWLLLAGLFIAAFFSPRVLALTLLVLSAPICFLTIRRKSFSAGIYSFCSWNLVAAGLWIGLMRPRRHPDAAIAANILKTPRVAASSI